MARNHLRDLVVAAICASLAFLPWLAEGHPDGYCIGAAALLAGLLLGIRAVAVVVLLCAGTAAGVYVDMRVSPPGDRGGRALFVYFCLTVFPLALSAIAVCGALVRRLVTARP